MRPPLRSIPSRGGQPSRQITKPAVSATSTVAILPHMSDARRAPAISRATNVGTASVSSAMPHMAQPSRHHGPAASVAAADAMAWATMPTAMLDMFMPLPRS